MVISGELAHLTPAENKRRKEAGELYHAFAPDLQAERDRCEAAYKEYNDNRNYSRREVVRLWRKLVCDDRPMPPKLEDEEADAAQFHESDAYVDSPQTSVDFGYNVRIAPRAYLNRGCTFIDTTPINIGARTLIGASCHFYSGTHPLDPAIRNGTEGPESGAPINIGEDCWLGGNVTVVPGITIGRGSTVGAGSVVTKDVPPFHLVVGNPARIVRRIDSPWDPNRGQPAESYKPKAKGVDGRKGPEEAMAEQAIQLEKKGA